MHDQRLRRGVEFRGLLDGELERLRDGEAVMVLGRRIAPVVQTTVAGVASKRG